MASIEAHNGNSLISVLTMNSLKETKLVVLAVVAMNCHSIVILHNEKYSTE